MEHSRSTLEKLMPAVGDSMVTNRRRPILTVVEDTSPGVHDTLLSACDAERYRLLGCPGDHANCADNLLHALAAEGIPGDRVPSPWNLFENVTVGGNGALEIQPPLSKPGDYVALRAEMDVLIGNRFLLSGRKVVRVWATVGSDDFAVLVVAHPLVVGDTDEFERSICEQRTLDAATA